MNDKKRWMLMTYYCPTHGDLGIVKPIEITKKEISATYLQKGKISKNWVFIIKSKSWEKALNIWQKIVKLMINILEIIN